MVGSTRLTVLCTLLMLALAGPVQAAMLQISPVTIEMAPGQNAAGLTLDNPGDQAIYGQVRVFRWDQSQGDDALSPTQDVVASPPLIQIQPNGEQLVRLIKTADKPSTSEQSYRILIDELTPEDMGPSSGVMIRMRYSVPVFIQPSGRSAPAALDWRLSRHGQDWTLQARNTGGRRAQISDVQLIAGSGKTIDLNKGLLGYALARKERRWEISLPANTVLDKDFRIRAIVNTIAQEDAIQLIKD